ncbi:MAG: hypothetical protein OXC56_05845 [Chloroflexi bacterium]|nr:hypothetical protein [Chloroflexota bacterium]
MTTVEADAVRVFADARRVQEAALRQMAAGDIRDAAEKAWCAAKRATDGLILARTGEEPRRSTDTGSGLRALERVEPEAGSLRARYYERQGALHGECFYIGLCEPVEGIERLIRETGDYIDDARRLAGV